MSARKRWILFAALMIVALTLLAACVGVQQPAGSSAEPPLVQTDAGEPVAESAGPDTASETGPLPIEEVVIRAHFVNFAGENLDPLQPLFDQFEAETGTSLEIIVRGEVDKDYLANMEEGLATQAGEIDVYLIDLIWTGILAEHALDLSDFVGKADLEAHLPNILEDYSVGDKLVALPLFVDVGQLYYRADLLEKYGYEAPPATWDELEEMAATIQAGERAAGNDEFWGYVWQGANYEGLTCNALEWQASHSGGHIIEPDGTITVNNPNTVAAFERAAGWIGTISPPDTIDYDEFSSLATWIQDDAAFMRWWPAWIEMDLHPALLEGRYGATLLPATEGQPAATLGGWGLMVSRYSEHSEQAVRLVELLTGPEAQKLVGFTPTIEALYRDSDMLARQPYLADMLPVVKSAVARPSTVTGAQYAEVSAAYHNHVHDILTGEVSAAEGVANLEAELVDITGFQARVP